VQPKTEKVVAKDEPACMQEQKKITKTARKSVSPKAQQLMARIASSFMHEAQDEQQHVVTIIGDPNKMPTAEQIKREQYLAKLQQCFYTSHSTLRNHMPRIHEKPINPIISMKVHRDGSASSICMIKSSSNTELDQFYLLVFQDASRSFPPLPSYFPLSYYIFQWLIVLS
jgi:hypothetical protein